eukprot:UN29229
MFLLLFCLAFIVTTSSRIELHVHLDGAIPVDVLYEIAENRSLSLPFGIGIPKSVDDINKLLDHYELWEKFDVVNSIIGGDKKSLFNIGEWFVRQQSDMDIIYSEVRYDPYRLISSNYTSGTLTLESAINSFTEGLVFGMEQNPGHHVYQILCHMRDSGSDRCMEIADLASKLYTKDPGGVVAIDIAGVGKYNNTYYIPCYKYAKSLGLNTTVHAGEPFPGNDLPIYVKTAI